MQLITIKASPYLILIMDHLLLQMVFWLVLAVTSAGVTAKSAKLIREKSRKLLILYSVETGASEQTYFEFSWTIYCCRWCFGCCWQWPRPLPLPRDQGGRPPAPSQPSRPPIIPASLRRSPSMNQVRMRKLLQYWMTFRGPGFLAVVWFCSPQEGLKVGNFVTSGCTRVAPIQVFSREYWMIYRRSGKEESN